MNEILVVDDEPVNRLIIQKILDKKGYRTHLACNGLEAIIVLDKNPQIDLVLLDLNMPKKDGYSFLKYINSEQDYQNRNVWVIIISATPEEEFYSRIKLLEISNYRIIGYCEKPFAFETLLETIKLHFDNG